MLRLRQGLLQLLLINYKSKIFVSIFCDERKISRYIFRSMMMVMLSFLAPKPKADSSKILQFLSLSVCACVSWFFYIFLLHSLSLSLSLSLSGFVSLSLSLYLSGFVSFFLCVCVSVATTSILFYNWITLSLYLFF